MIMKNAAPGLIPEILIKEQLFLKPFSSGSEAGGPGTPLQQHGYKQLIKRLQLFLSLCLIMIPSVLWPLSIEIPTCHTVFGGLVALFFYFAGSKERKVDCGANITVLLCFILDNLEGLVPSFCNLRKGVIFSLPYLGKPVSAEQR